MLSFVPSARKENPDLMEGSSSMASKPVDAFLCTICTEVLYKPVVLVCGHALCFWCAHKSMSRIKTSVCPSCRVTYSFFPQICQKLHLLLWKIDPAAQERRREETRGMEEVNRIQSAKVEDPEVVPPQVTDATCDECKQLVFRPCVLHCGHVHCEMCIPKGDGVITCPSCQGQHPSANPTLFWDLHLYLEREFPLEYASRRESQALLSEEHHGSTSEKQKISDWGSEDNYHVAVGCDHCGMYPIRGNRYKCVECKEDVGFDLCETCYQSRESHPKQGRFNQEHNSSHTFEVRNPRAARNMLFTLLSPPVEELNPPVQEDPPVEEESGDESGDEELEVQEFWELPPLPPVLLDEEESGDEDLEDEEESGDEDSEDDEESGDEESEDEDEIGDEESGDEDSEDDSEDED